MPVCVIFNPAAKGGKARRFQRSLPAFGPACAFRPTEGPGSARFLATAAVNEGFDTLVAAGGDGTLNEVLNGMAEAPGGFERARLGVLPLGTVNVLARELKVPARIEAAWRIIQQGQEARIDLCWARWKEGARAGQRCFVQLAGAGLDAHAIERVSWKLKQRIGWLAYVVAGWQVLRERQPAIRITAGGRVEAGELVLMGNGRFYGGNFRLFPGAKMDDGLLDVLVFRRVIWRTACRCVWGVFAGRLDRQAGLSHFQTNSVVLESNTAVAWEADGEWAGRLPVTITIQPRVLRMIVPGLKPVRI